MKNSPVPTLVTRLEGPEAEVEQAVFAAGPEEEGLFMRVTVRNTTVSRTVFVRFPPVVVARETVLSGHTKPPTGAAEKKGP